MWDTVDTSSSHLSHDMPCPRCGHGRHTYLACSDTCTCRSETEATSERKLLSA
ncbi:hypothetical protein [Nocardioides euryhalodurans]|uniref:hypothetical protein n=1 Tax=Nocardioides euryhalodurans TaxID=2518370 RepID=UPI00141EFD98|nr:hypothetical protein [Nocardioides euryhalodurans]